MAGVIWALVPIVTLMIVGISRSDTDLILGLVDTHPFVQAVIAVDGAIDGTYFWPGMDSANATGSTIWMLKIPWGP